MEDNSSQSDVLFPQERPWHIIFTTLLMIMLIVTTVIGNVFVIVAVFNYKPLRIVPNFFIVSLATADLLVALIVMPFHVSNNVAGEWLYGAVFCDIWLTFDVLLCTASILNICVIALDRYWAIHDPINYAQKRTVKRVLFMIIIAWLASAIISVPPLLGWDEMDDPVKSECTLTIEKGYVLYSACGSFYIPLCVMSFVYLKIYLATKKRLRQRCRAAAATKMAVMSAAKTSTSTDDNEETENPNCKKALVNQSDIETPKNGPSRAQVENNSRTIRKRKSILNFFEEKQRISLSKERKAARTLAIIMVTFVLCWIPFFLMYIIIPFCDSCVHPGKWVEVLFVWLGYVNSTLNPVIYTVFNTEFRKAFKDIFSCRKGRGRFNSVTRTNVWARRIWFRFWFHSVFTYFVMFDIIIQSYLQTNNIEIGSMHYSSSKRVLYPISELFINWKKGRQI